jgi:hypothetical protein
MISMYNGEQSSLYVIMPTLEALCIIIFKVGVLTSITLYENQFYVMFVFWAHRGRRA